MSYENPITVIDRESGQIWANAISGVSKSIADGIEKANKNMSLKQKTAQAELTAQSEYIIKNQAAFNAQAAKNGINNPSLFAAGKRVIDSMAEANMQVKNAKTKEAQQIALEKYSTIQKSYQNLVAGINAGGEADKTYKQDRIGTGIKGWKAPGKQGGMSVVGSDTQSFIKRMNVRVGLGQGATEEYIDNGDGTWNLQYTGGSYGDEIVSVPMSQSLTYDAGLVPDIDAEIYSVFDKPSGENEDGTQFSILDSNGRYNKEYLNTKGSYIEKSTPGKDGSYVETTITPVDTAKIVQAAVGGLKSKAASYLKDYNTANKVWMEVLGNEEPLGRSGVGVGDESTKEFTSAFIEYGRKKLPNFNITDQKEVEGYQNAQGLNMMIDSSRKSGPRVVKLSNSGSEKTSDTVKRSRSNATEQSNVILNSINELGASMNFTTGNTVIEGSKLNIGKAETKDRAAFEGILDKLGYYVTKVGGLDEIVIQRQNGTKTMQLKDGADLKTFIMKITEAEGVSKAEAKELFKNIEKQISSKGESQSKYNKFLIK